MGRLGGAGQRSAATAAGSKLAGGAGGGYGDADVAKLKDAIQTLCQSTNPLGEAMSSPRQGRKRDGKRGYIRRCGLLGASTMVYS